MGGKWHKFGLNNKFTNGAPYTQNVKPWWSLMGVGGLQELRLYWVKILPHYHLVTAETHVLNFIDVQSQISRKNTVLAIEKFPSLVLARNAIMLTTTPY